MSNIVEYILNLKDNMSPALGGVTNHVKEMEGALSGAKSMATGLAEALGIGFAVFKGVEFIKESVEKVHELHLAESELTNTMQNMGTYSKEAFEEIIGKAKELHETLGLSTSKVVSMQSQFGLIGTIGSDEMNKLVLASANMAAKFGGEASDWGTALAKGINDPLMARRIEAKVFIDPAIKAHIKELADAGDNAGARLALMAAVEEKVGGAAKAAFDATPMARFHIIMEDLSISVGGVAMDLLEELAPALEVVANAFKWAFDGAKSLINWFKDHKETIKDTAIVIGAVTVALGAMLIPVYAGTIGYWALGVGLSAYSAAQTVATAVTWLFSAALWSTGIPEVVLAVAALTTGIIALTKHFGGFSNAVSGSWEIIKAFGKGVGGVFFGIGEMIAGIFSPKLMAKGLSDVLDSVKTAGIEIHNAWNNKDAQDAANSHKSLVPESHAKSLLPEKAGPAGKQGKQGEVIAAPKTKAEGQKTINIHVAYNAPLIKDFTISTTNIKEGLGELKAKVSAILTGATHDSLMVADY